MTSWRLLTTLACGLALVGCGTSSKEAGAVRANRPWSTTQPTAGAPAEGPRLTFSDPCWMRLHDLCGPLLLYLHGNYRLPDALEELRQMPGAQGLELACPVSGLPYVYNREGIVGPNVATRAVVYDAVPHAGYRFAIIVKEATPNAPLQAEAVKWPESRFPK